MPKIGFIGLGNMGGPMAANLVKSGEQVLGFDVVAASRDASAASGAEIVANAKSCVENAEVVITMLPAGQHVLSVWKDILPAANQGALSSIARPSTWRARVRRISLPPSAALRPSMPR